MRRTTKQKIAIIAPYWRPARISGTELFNEMVFNALLTKYDVTVITSDSYCVRYYRNLFENRRISSSANIVRLRHYPFKAFIRRFTNPQLEGPAIKHIDLYKVLNNKKFSGVYLSSIPHELNLITVNVVQSLQHKPRIYICPNYHADIYKKRDEFHNYILQKAFSIHVWTKAEKKILMERYAINTKKIRVMTPPCIGTVGWNNRKRLSTDNKVIILYSGEKNGYKGIYSLIDALKRTDTHNVKLITIGPHSWRWELYKCTHNNPFLKDLGYVDHKTKEKLFSECDIFCLPSHADSFGFAYLDAWRHKKPVIASDTPVMREVVGKGGLFVDRRNPQAFSRTLKTLINNKKLRDKLGRIGFRSLARFSYRKNIKRFLRIFK